MVYAELIHPDPHAGMIFLADYSIHERFAHGPSIVPLIVIGKKVFRSPAVRHSHVLTDVEASLVER